MWDEMLVQEHSYGQSEQTLGRQNGQQQGDCRERNKQLVGRRRGDNNNLVRSSRDKLLLKGSE
jgi:hypothetical protein